MTVPPLLAKSTSKNEAPSPSRFLLNHLQDVYTSAVQVLDSTGNDQMNALKLEPSKWTARLRSVVTLAAALHDLGKANDHFQAMLDDNWDGTQQGLRHEWATLLILALPNWREWLTPALADSTDWDHALSAIAGHHPAHKRPSPPTEPQAGRTEIILLTGHPDFHDCQKWLRSTFQLSEPPFGLDVKRHLATSRSNSVFPELGYWCADAIDGWQSHSAEEKRFVAAVKACLIAADVAGSALPRTNMDAQQRRTWIASAFERKPTPEQLHQIVTDRLDGKELRPFQRAGAQTQSRVTFVRAGCGSGKTILADLWAAQRCPGKRLYICYPTTGTATEGFRDYFVDADQHSKFGADLFHGRAEVDLEMLAVTQEEPLEEPDDPEIEIFQRIESFESWSTPIVCCTVDTVLGLMQNNRRGLFGWPALAGAAFVFDEIHAYDELLFGALLRFLQEMHGVPVLLMTASLPVGRHEAIVELLHRQNETMHEVPGPADLEQLPRYHRWTGDISDPVGLVKAELASGGKVLWVSNTVNRVMRRAEETRDLWPMIYHSRYRYEDRVARHKDVIDAFQATGVALAICSQVAEMSLDLSASLLITDLCPVSALIQRLGRLNRRAVPGPPGKSNPPTMPFVVLEPLDDNGNLQALPYTEAELKTARKWLAELGIVPLSQADLATSWKNMDKSPAPRVGDSAWLDGGPTTQVHPLRKASPGITVLREQDLPLLRKGTPLVRLLLPMPDPRPLPWQKWRRCKGIPIAPAGTILYDNCRGAQWQK
jgi:CRISPR-associated endonuclease/helicase Cas3